MNAIRDMSNLGPHGGEVDATDAVRVMRDLVDVLEWYVVHYDPSCLVSNSREARQALEILPQLRDEYPRYMWPEIISVKFTQLPDRCYLEITTTERVNDYLVDETTKRTDLAFIAGGTGWRYRVRRSVLQPDQPDHRERPPLRVGLRRDIHHQLHRLVHSGGGEEAR